MKTFKECIDSSFATPANTIGMGNVSDTSGDMLAFTKAKKKKKMKSLKEYILTKPLQK